MELNLQFFGGRGASSGIGGGGGAKGLSVTVDGNTTEYYFTRKNGQNYYQRSINGTPEPTPQNMSIQQFKARVESNGATTKSISTSEYAKKSSNAKADREATDKFLNQSWYGDKATRRTRKGWKGH